MDAIFEGYWFSIKDGDPRGRDLYRRHYSYRAYKDGRNPRTFVGPGEKIVLLTLNGDALFVWRNFRPMDGQIGINCSIFRNESAIKSSVLILEAMQVAWNHKGWNGQRLYTYVHPGKIKSANPGYCFKMAGWRQCGYTAHGLVILEALP